MERGAPLSVLVLDDNLRLRQTLVDALRERGHAITVCEDAETAWDAYRQVGHALLLVGVHSHQAENEALLRRIRSLPAGGAPVVLVNCGDQPPHRLVPLLDVADDVLARPLKANSLDLRLAAAEKLVKERVARSAVEAECQRLRSELKNPSRPAARSDSEESSVAAPPDADSERVGFGGRVRQIFKALGGTQRPAAVPNGAPPAPEAAPAPVPDAATPPSAPLPAAALPVDGAAPPQPAPAADPNGPRLAALEWDLKKG